MFRNFIGTTAAIAANFYIYNKLNLVPKPGPRDTTESNIDDPYVKLTDKSVTINFDNIRKKIEGALGIIEHEPISPKPNPQPNSGQQTIFAPELRQQGNTLFLRKIPANAKVIVTDNGSSRKVLIESPAQNNNLWGNSNNQFQTWIPVNVELDVPKDVNVIYKK